MACNLSGAWEKGECVSQHGLQTETSSPSTSHWDGVYPPPARSTRMKGTKQEKKLQQLFQHQFAIQIIQLLMQRTLGREGFVLYCILEGVPTSLINYAWDLCALTGLTPCGKRLTNCLYSQPLSMIHAKHFFNQVTYCMKQINK